MIELDSEQIKTIHALSPTLVYASAGSGKTRCLIAKIIQLLEKGINPENICSITFTNKAANEMKERLNNQCSIPTKGMQMSTIHSLCVRIIKTFINFTPLKYPFSIYDEGDQSSIIKTIVKSKKLNKDPEEYISNISKYKSGSIILYEDCETVYNTYQEILLKNNACDFDDLLIYALNCLKQTDCKNYFSNLWKHILVDEFQDTSIIQYNIIKSIYDLNKTKTLFVIGDSNQSIYSWRGAYPENMNSFIKEFNPSVCSLTFNYRSCSGIIKHANNFLQFGKSMISKNPTEGKVSFTQFNSYEDEAEKISEAIIKMGNYENTAILFRVNTRTHAFEKVFTQKRLPYKIVGALPFYRRKIAKDLLSYCKAATNRSDIESLNRIVNTPKRGFGETKQEKLLHEGWPYLNSVSIEMPPIKSFINLLDSIKNKKPVDAVNEIIHETGYRSLLIKNSDILMLNSFIDVISGFNTIEELILASTFLEEDSGHGVKLMTAHASKGLEFDRVFVVGVEEDLWPHKFSTNTDEENRLFYVACTRAKKYLNISYSKNKLYKGVSIEVKPSYLFLNGAKHLQK